MSAMGWHVTMRLVDDRVLAPSVEARRTFAETVLRIGQPYKLLFLNLSGNHAHLAVACDRARVTHLARSLAHALRSRLSLSVPFARYHKEPIADQRHLAHLRGYILGNPERHGLWVDPYHEASNLPDLLGLRVIGLYTCVEVRERLPNLKRADLLEHLGLPALMEGQDLTHLEEATAAAIGAPRLSGRPALRVAARVAAIHVGRELGGTPGDLASRLGLSGRELRRLSRRRPEPDLARAIRRQLWLREQVRPADPQA